MKKRIAAMVLAGAMALSLAPAYGATEVKAEASDMKIAMVTDSGDITDQSFNQTTYEACKEWATDNGSDFNYYKPESDSDEARNASVDQAVADGANVIVLPGYMFAATIVEQSEMYPDVKFIAPDVSAGDICEKGVGEGYTYNPDDYEVTDYYNADNVYCCTYQEEVSGYMAGYAAVKFGYKHLGFLGGMSVPAVTRFGYGYIQGADEAAKELGITDEVELEYVCGGQFYGDADITAYMDTWYGSKGVEVVFACGGGIYTSAAEAAAKVDGKVIGVDSDQSGIIGEDITVTSAMKGLAPTVKTALDAIKDGNWESDYAGKIDNLGLVSENPEDNYVQLPMDTTQWDDNFTVDDYKDLVSKLYNGEITVSNDITALPETEIAVNDYGSIK
ncbi:BMP family ABC transporter substrate-binding protein [Blautia glucerasea]|uniref:BMP family ABC transporter substrate-binding protein n=1 Tax=Blautia glucerasea TaxID=536633 RepID=UPI00156FEB7A|nr:BMP family ABC transporter substrate-binding protein [Blautia glucerasea]NSL03027.1 BMP family ABC transporter substrate-binding protein [Blautia glucerasea]